MVEERSAKPLIFDVDPASLQKFLLEHGEPDFRFQQIWQGLYQKYLDSTDKFTNIPKPLRSLISSGFEFSHLRPAGVLASKDGETVKTLFRLPDGNAIEAVLMRYSRRRTLCISTQAGCAMGCVFCATGQMGFRRNLSSGEIIEQVLYYARQLAANSEKVTNVVLMGMGEPFHNYDASLAAIDRLNDARGFGLGARQFTISTVGVIPGIRRFTSEHRQINLAISLHAADDDLRSSLLPINHRYPLTELMNVCLEYVNTTSRRISFEWALIEGVNDSVQQAHMLVSLLKPFRRDGASLCHVNVIPLNPTHNYSGRATTRKQAYTFQRILEDNGIHCTVRLRRGIDIQAGYGQLATQ